MDRLSAGRRRTVVALRRVGREPLDQVPHVDLEPKQHLSDTKAKDKAEGCPMLLPCDLANVGQLVVKDVRHHLDMLRIEAEGDLERPIAMLPAMKGHVI